MRSSANLDVIKEPRGFIKVIEIFLAIFAFACATGYRGYFKISQILNGKLHPVEGHFKYPFASSIELTMLGENDTMKQVMVNLSERSSAEFFVVIGVFCFIYSVGVLVYYIMFQEDQGSVPTTSGGYLTPPVIDFVAGAFWAFFWFVSSCAQAAAVNGVKDATDVSSLVKTLPYCLKPFNSVCDVAEKAKYATLTVSILFGFLNTFVWAGNMWFLWKETPFHKERKPTATVNQPQQHQQIPPANAI